MTRRHTLLRRLTVLVVGSGLAALPAHASSAAASIDPTMTPGVPVTATVTTPGEQPTFTFEATAGERMTLAVTDVDWRRASAGGQPGTGYAIGVLERPDGSFFAQLNGASNQPTFDERDLDATGLWTLTVQPAGDSTGQQTMTLGLVTDTTRAIPLGSPVTVEVPTVGQRTDLTFAGKPGQRVVVSVSSTDWRTDGPGTGSAYVSLLRPDGSFFSGIVDMRGFPTMGEAGRLLDAAGTWRLRVDPWNQSTGSARLLVRRVTDQASPTTPGTPTTVRVRTRGQNVGLTFTGQVGKRVTLSITKASWTSVLLGRGPGSGSSFASLYRPDGSYFTSLVGTSDVAAFGESPPLDVGGTWRVEIDPSLDSVGSQTSTVRLVADVRTRIVPGTPRTTTLGAGQDALHHFTARAGQRVVVDVSAAAFTSAVNGGGAGSGSTSVVLQDPRGFRHHLTVASSGPTHGESEVLEATGTYYLVLDGDGDTRGTMTTTLTLAGP